LAERDRRIGVVAHLGRQVEGDAEAGLALIEQESVALVRLGGRAEACVLPHRPQPPPVHRGVDPARVRKRARRPQGLASGIDGDVGGAVDRLQMLVRARLIFSYFTARVFRALSPRYRGIFPCFPGGFWSRLVAITARPPARRGRVSRGRMTSST